MKRLSKILSGVALLAVMGTVMACNPDGNLPADDSSVYSGNEITFTATGASVNAEDVKLFVKYDRTAAGAKEQIKLSDVDLSVTYNGTAVTMDKTISFELDPYGANFGTTAVTDLKEYKVKLPLNKKISAGDVIKVQLKSAAVSGEGKDTVDLTSVVVALIDTNVNVGYYSELCADEYQSLISFKDGVAIKE